MPDYKKAEGAASRFISNEIDGFVVSDEAFAEAERILNEQIQCSSSNIVLIEFARDSARTYETTCQQFAREVLEQSIVVYLNADLSMCLQRVHDRQKQGSHGSYPDRVFVERYQYALTEATLATLVATYGFCHSAYQQTDVERPEQTIGPLLLDLLKQIH
jgi:hypothetical protein